MIQVCDKSIQGFEETGRLREYSPLEKFLQLSRSKGRYDSGSSPQHFTHLDNYLGQWHKYWQHISKHIKQLLILIEQTFWYWQSPNITTLLFLWLCWGFKSCLCVFRRRQLISRRCRIVFRTCQMIFCRRLLCLWRWQLNLSCTQDVIHTLCSDADGKSHFFYIQVHWNDWGHGN